MGAALFGALIIELLTLYLELALLDSEQLGLLSGERFLIFDLTFDCEDFPGLFVEGEDREDGRDDGEQSQGGGGDGGDLARQFH